MTNDRTLSPGIQVRRTRRVRTWLGMLDRERWADRWLGWLVSKLHGMQSPSFHQAERHCRRHGWPCLLIEESGTWIFLARTPFGMRTAILPVPAYDPDFFLTDLFLTDLVSYAHDQGFDKSRVFLWNEELSRAYIRQICQDLPQGCTPLIGPLASFHQRLAWVRRWGGAQVGMKGWSGAVPFLPQAVSIDPQTSEGIGSCMIALRHGNLLGLVITRLEDVDGWCSPDMRIPLPDSRWIGIYDLGLS